MIPYAFSLKRPRPRRLAMLAGAAAVMAASATSSFAASVATIHVILDNKPNGQQVLQLDKKSVKAGKVVFDVSNISKDELHEFLVVKTPLAADKLPMNADGTRVDESKLKNIKELGDLNPGKSGSIALNLKPGHYVLLCNQPGHYTGGMEGNFTVTK
jgi:uncharacterized cupredoxin-like copper-binding protein